MPTDYILQCSYADCSKVAPDHGKSVIFRGQTVTIEAQCTIPTLSQSDVLASVKLYGIRDDTIPPAATKATQETLNEWDKAGRFKSAGQHGGCQ